MNKNKTKILILGIIAVLLGGYQTALAGSSSLYVSPASLSKTVGESFNVSVNVNSAGNKVCAVEGTLNLSKLSCQSVSLGQGVMAQSTPSCSNTYFLIGIPGCTTGDKALFTMNVKGTSAGTAGINFSGTDVIGEGVPVAHTSSAGSYVLASSGTGQGTPLPGSGEQVVPPAGEEQTYPPVNEGTTSFEGTATSEEAAGNKKPVEMTADISKIMQEIGESNWKIIVVIFCLIGLGIIGGMELNEYLRKRDKN